MHALFPFSNLKTTKIQYLKTTTQNPTKPQVHHDVPCHPRQAVLPAQEPRLLWAAVQPGHAVQVQHSTTRLCRGPPEGPHTGHCHTQQGHSRQRGGLCSTEAQVCGWVCFVGGLVVLCLLLCVLCSCLLVWRVRSERGEWTLSWREGKGMGWTQLPKMVWLLV